MSLELFPMTLHEANQYVRSWHRHHVPVRGCRFVVAALERTPACVMTVGVVIVGRPVARGSQDGVTCEVTRLVTNGHKNACSLLYAAAARAAKALGYWRIQTYILAVEPGTSLRAAGWRLDGTVRGRPWARDWDDPTARQLLIGGTTRRTDQPTTDKQRWVKDLRHARKDCAPGTGRGGRPLALLSSVAGPAARLTPRTVPAT
jgi:hypothetical protein